MSVRLSAALCYPAYCSSSLEWRRGYVASTELTCDLCLVRYKQDANEITRSTGVSDMNDLAQVYVDHYLQSTHLRADLSTTPWYTVT